MSYLILFLATSKTNSFWLKRQICKMYHDVGGI